MLSKWIFASALILAGFFVGCGRPPGVPGQGGAGMTPYVASYENLRTAVFQSKCVSCHNSTHGAGNVDLSDYKKIVDQSVFPPLVIPGNPEASSLYQVVESGKMPKRGPPLSSAEVQAIYDWIKKGAPETETAAPSPTPAAGEPGGGHGEPGEPGNLNEPCDNTAFPGEPGILNCNEPF
jgi:hypothetical protein